MKIDKEQLKALALAASADSWKSPAVSAFMVAANPDTILALLGEIERLSKNPFAQAVDAVATAAASHLASEAKGCVEKGLLETIEQVKAENEALRSQLAALQAEPNSYQSGFDAGRAAEKAHADNWRAEADGLRRDAKRYRFLRNQHWPVAYLAVVISPKVAVKLGHDCPSGDRLDEQVDGAMKREASHD